MEFFSKIPNFGWIFWISGHEKSTLIWTSLICTESDQNICESMKLAIKSGLISIFSIFYIFFWIFIMFSKNQCPRGAPRGQVRGNSRGAPRGAPQIAPPRGNPAVLGVLWFSRTPHDYGGEKSQKTAKNHWFFKIFIFFAFFSRKRSH